MTIAQNILSYCVLPLVFGFVFSLAMSAMARRGLFLLILALAVGFALGALLK